MGVGGVSLPFRNSSSPKGGGGKVSLARREEEYPVE
jgi:hypothetical protein